MRPPDRLDQPDGWGRRILWFIALWFAGVAVVAVIAYAIRWALMP